MRPTLLYQTLYAESKTCLSWTVEFTMKPLEMYFGVGESLFDKLMLLKEKKKAFRMPVYSTSSPAFTQHL